MTFARRIRVLIILAGLCVSCASLRPVVDNLPKAVAYAQDAELILTGVATFEAGYFVVSPNPALQKKVEAGIADARTALDAGIRICAGTTALSQSQVADAFADFRTAYADVLALLGPLGAHRAAPGSHMGATPNGYAIPDPLILSVR